MLQFGEHGVVVGTAARAPVVASADLRVQGVAQRRRDGQGILMEEEVTRQTSLVPQAHDIVVTQIVLHIERIVMNALGGHCIGEDADIDHAGGRQPIGSKGQNRVGVGRIPQERMRIRREGIRNAGIRRGRV